jgi:hypothetical protein
MVYNYLGYSQSLLKLFSSSSDELESGNTFALITHHCAKMDPLWLSLRIHLRGQSICS